MKSRALVNLVTQMAFAGLTLAALIIHALTFVGYNPREFSRALWCGLHVSAAFALILALIVFGLKRKNALLALKWSLDQLVVFLFVFFVFYACFNFFFTSIVLLHGGSPEIVNGHYTIGSHGFFTTISKEEFLKYMIYEARLHSGHWMAFFFFAVAALRWKSEIGRGD